MMLGALALAAVTASSPPPERTAAVIETFIGWAVLGREVASDPPHPAPVLPHRSCGGRFDPAHPPATIYVSWQLSAEAQHAACNWKYDVASRRATALSSAEAAEVAQKIVAGTIGPHERAFFHAVPKTGGRLAVTAGYCWGSAGGLFEFRSGNPVLIGDLALHGY